MENNPGRKGDVELFMSGNCFYATYQPTLLQAIQEVLERLPEEAFETLVTERDIHIFFPESNANTVYLMNDVMPPNAELRTKPRWFVQLADYLNSSSHMKVVGTIAREFAHVYLKQAGLPSNIKDLEEEKADDLAITWGFEQEIAASKEQKD